MKKLLCVASAVLAALTLAAGPAMAQQGLRPSALYAQLGAAERGTYQATLGAVWPWSWRARLLGAEVSARGEVYVSHWQADAIGGGRQSYTQLGLLPVLRLRFGQGRSDWFAEAGIGVTWMDRPYATPHRQFSTSGNFHDMVGVGYSFGSRREHELGLRLVHHSNAGIRRPNPGIEFLQLRYARTF